MLTQWQFLSAWTRARFGGTARGEAGASLVEYALLMALIAVVCIGALQFFGSQSGNSLDTSGSKIVAAG